MFTHDQLAAARQFVLLNARVLERQLFAFHFEGGSPLAVERSLLAYQNSDGGFGNGLEPDKRTPESQPQDVEVAFRILDSVGRLSGDVLMPALNWLSSICAAEGGVPYTLPSAQPYPHAPWWKARADQPPADLNPTAAITGLALKHNANHSWLDAATAFCWRSIEASESVEFHELTCVLTFLQSVPDEARADRAIQRIRERVATPGVVALDPLATGYVQKPLDFAPRPDSELRSLFDDSVIAEHLRVLAAQQRDDGGWPISWPAISPGVELECRGRMTIEALLRLRAYAHFM